MVDFTIRFFICNVFICGMIGILLIARRIFRNILSSRMQYHLWFLLLLLLAAPFMPFSLIGFPQILSWFRTLKHLPAFDTGMITGNTAGTNPSENTDWMNDFVLSVNSKTPSIHGYLLLGVWITGILIMLLLAIRSFLRLRALKKSALPLQNPEVRRLYHRCLKELRIRKSIPVYSTAFLKSPAIVGFLKPVIYLPIHLISDYNESDVRYILLHELQHYKHKDTAAIYLLNLAGIVYWFNPFVWHALREMRSDIEISCDTAVLKMLDANAYEDYGNTLINFAEKISLAPFPFTASLSGNMRQMKRRILNIASYEKPTFKQTLKGMTAFLLTAFLLLGFAPFISVYAAETDHYQWKISEKDISARNFEKQFGTYTGSFVLYDLESSRWIISGKEQATTRTAPNSTYKIYNSLFALDTGIISPEHSQLAWNQTPYPFEAWNKDQTLDSAMASSVNWYFQTLDKQMGKSTLQSYIDSIGYGNRNISGELSSYWMESTLMISPVEQVELLTGLYQNDFEFAPEHIQAVKDSIRLSSTDSGTIYGKTGTGRTDGRDVNGWFVGFIEAENHTYFFATNIEAKDGATGGRAAEITMSILSDMNLWK